MIIAKDNNSYVADAYFSMEEFWSNMDDHEKGLSDGTIWDTYECGERRKLESRLAVLYGAPDATVICSGMGAITTAILAVSAAYQIPIECEKKYGYFENSDLIENLFKKLGLVGEIGTAGVKLIEPITNEPSLRVNLCNLKNSSETGGFSIIDNSLFSVSAPWKTWSEQISNSFCVVESLPKYITHSVSGGVVYGEKEVIQKIRETARRMGMLLPRHSCISILEDKDVKTVKNRLEKMGNSANLFAQTIREERPELTVRLPQEVAQGAGLPNVQTSLVFILYPDELNPLEEFEFWSREVSKLQGRPVVRAGYGWNYTYGRIYGNNKLNTNSGKTYLRFSIGLEDQDTIKQMAKILKRVNK